jgi:hypothetical protein
VGHPGHPQPRQTGSALGSAVVLAVLENRLAAGHGYVGAMRYAIAVPVTALLIGALLCLALKPTGGVTTARSGQEERAPEQDPQRVAG